MLPSPNPDLKFQNPARGLAALATGFAAAVNTVYAMPVNVGGGLTDAYESMTKPTSKGSYEPRHAQKGLFRKRKGDKHATKKSAHKTTRIAVKPTQSAARFADILQATVKLFSSTQAKHGRNFDTSAEYEYSTETPMALQRISDTKHIQLVVLEKAHNRAAIVIEKQLWDTEQQVMVWTEFAEDSTEDGMTIDYVSCRQTVASASRSKWHVPPSEQLSYLSRQACEAFVAYLNKISI